MNFGGNYSWPTVIIGGAPRSGTSSLFDMLHSTGAFRRHSRKELFLLNDRNFWIHGETPGYEEVGSRCYDLAGFGPKECFVDASTTYLYQDVAPDACTKWLAVNRSSPFVVIFCLREPAERLYSNFRYFRDVLLLIPEETSFVEHVDALLDRTVRTGNQQIDQALDHGLYPQYLKRWESAVGAKRIIVIRTDELTATPQAVVSRIGTGIDLPLTIGVSARKNASYKPRFRNLHSIARRFGAKIPHGRVRESLKAAYVRLTLDTPRSSERRDDLLALDRVRSYYKKHSDEFETYGLTWYEAA